jgi:uncharacterized protein (UPF0335 family)
MRGMGIPAFVNPTLLLERRFPKDGEVALNQQVKDLIQKLGAAIHESVSESDQISGVVREIREQGFDVLLMLEATIGLNEVDDDAEEAEPEAGSDAEAGPFTRHDLNFLKSLRITTEETDATAAPSPRALNPPRLDTGIDTQIDTQIDTEIPDPPEA